MPGFKGEHGAPVEPKVGFKKFWVQHVGDLLVVELFVRCHEQFDDAHGSLIGQGKLSVGVSIFATVLGCTHQRVVGIALIQPVIFVQNGGIRCFDGRNGAEKIPQTFEVVFHLAASADDKAELLILDAVAGAARQLEFL